MIGNGDDENDDNAYIFIQAEQKYVAFPYVHRSSTQKSILKYIILHQKLTTYFIKYKKINSIIAIKNKQIIFIFHYFDKLFYNLII